jgi:hypothetical protein
MIYFGISVALKRETLKSKDCCATAKTNSNILLFLIFILGSVTGLDYFTYLPSGGEVFKWAWIQYYSFFGIVAFVVMYIVGSVMQYQLLPSRLYTDRIASDQYRFEASTSATVSGKTFQHYNF